MSEKVLPYPDEEELGFLYDIKNTLKASSDKIVKKNRLF